MLVDVYPADASGGLHYEDDGESRAYLGGAFLERDFTQSRTPGGCAVTVAVPRGNYRPASRDLVLRVRWEGTPERVLLGTETLGQLKNGDDTSHGWRVEAGAVVVRFPDRFNAFTVTIAST